MVTFNMKYYDQINMCVLSFISSKPHGPTTIVIHGIKCMLNEHLTFNISKEKSWISFRYSLYCSIT